MFSNLFWKIDAVLTWVLKAAGWFTLGAGLIGGVWWTATYLAANPVDPTLITNVLLGGVLGALWSKK